MVSAGVSLSVSVNRYPPPVKLSVFSGPMASMLAYWLFSREAMINY